MHKRIYLSSPTMHITLSVLGSPNLAPASKRIGARFPLPGSVRKAFFPLIYKDTLDA